MHDQARRSIDKTYETVLTVCDDIVVVMGVCNEKERERS